MHDNTHKMLMQCHYISAHTHTRAQPMDWHLFGSLISASELLTDWSAPEDVADVAWLIQTRILRTIAFYFEWRTKKIFQSRFWFSIHVRQGAIIGIETNHWTNCHCRGTHTHILIYLKRNCLILRISNEMIAMELTKWNDKWYSCYFSSSEWNNGNMFVRFWMATFIFRIRVCFQ